MKKTIFVLLLFTQMVIAQVGIGTITPETSSALDVVAVDKGILIPRVSLVNVTNGTSPIDTPTTSLLVYNTNAAVVGGSGVGYYYWNASQWQSFTGVQKLDDLIDGKSDSDGSDDGSSIFLGIGAGANDSGDDNQNVGIGYQALNAHVGFGLAANTAIGYQALKDTTWDFNTAIGAYALTTNTVGYYNTAVGADALAFNSDGFENTAVGLFSLGNNSSGNKNAALGYYALHRNTTGERNIGIGHYAMGAPFFGSQGITGTDNIAIGSEALAENTSGSSNIAIGEQAIFWNDSGNNNIGIGYSALYYLSQNGNSNIALGKESLTDLLEGSNNIALGTESGVLSNSSHNLVGDKNVFIGYRSGYDVGPNITNRTLSGSVFLGSHSGSNELNDNRLYIENADADADNALIYGEFGADNTTTGNILRTNSQFQIGNPSGTGFAFPIADGTVSQVLQTDGSGNLSFQDMVVSDDDRINNLADGKSDSDGSDDGSSIFLGIGAGNSDDSSNNMNVGVGFNAMNLNSIGFGNVAVGYDAMELAAGDGHVAVGANALKINGGIGNVAIGNGSQLNSIGNLNTSVGFSSLGDISAGNFNVSIGAWSMLNKSSGNDNVALGYSALMNNAVGERNVIIGNSAGLNNNGSGNVFIGHNAGMNESGSNILYIDNSSTSAPLIYGDFATDHFRVNGSTRITDLAGVGNRMVVANANGDLLSQAINSGDITNVTAGTGMSGGGTTGAVTLNVNAVNGLTDTANDIRLGGTLIEDTTITQGNFDMTYNISGSGTFRVQDNGVPHFSILSSGTSHFGDDTYWRLGSTGSAEVLARMYDSSDDGVLDLYENNFMNIRLHGNGTTIFNNQNIATNDFRIESVSSSYNFFSDSSTNRIGIGTNVPVSQFHVSGGRVEFTATTDASGTANTGVLEIGNNLRIDSNEIITNTGSILSLQADNGGQLRVDGANFVVNGANGRVGLGTVAPAFRLQLSTNSAAKPTSNAWTVASDERLKTNLRTFTDGLNVLKQINPVWFTYNGKADMPNETGVGTLAQDFQKIAPYMVKPWEYTSEDGSVSESYLGIDYGPLNFVIVNAIQEQQEIIDNQNKKIDSLENKLEEQQREIDEIKALLKR